MKSSTQFVCQECGYESLKFMGKCPECGEWNSLKEIRVVKNAAASLDGTKTNISPKNLSEVNYEPGKRVKTGYLEMDSVMGGGAVPGSVTLLAGDPGVGKSTLLLQAALNISNDLKRPVLYISSEESEQQIKLRANRILGKGKSPFLFLLSVTDTDMVVKALTDLRPVFVVIDSIQTMESENLEGLSGSVGQVRYAASQFVRAAKGLNIPVVIVGHVTKEGMVAGPMVLSHMVDTVLFLEGEKNTGTRILRSLKNRFGPVDEVGIFEMKEGGIVEIKNPSEIFLKDKIDAPGSVLISILEGTRVFLVELQALAVYSKLPMPRRVASGFDYKRLELLLAVLQKHAKLPVENMDVFVNVAGGLKITDPAADLGVCLAIFSSLNNIPLSKTVAIAEVGLLGELRQSGFLEKRVKEAKKLGFTNVVSTQSHKTLVDAIKYLER